MSLVFGDFVFDQERRQLLRAGQPVRLEPKVYELLGLLLERRPTALSKVQIRDVLWPGTFVSESALSGLVADLRVVLGDDVRQPRFIRTVHGFGYAFSGEARETTPDQRVEAAAVETATRRPYPGLSSFTEADASRFFGREAEVEALLERIRRQKLLAVIGPSGVGKTSFLRAGVVSSRPSDWGALVMAPAGRPFAALAQALSRELSGDPDGLAELIQGIAGQAQDLKGVLSAVSRWRKKHAEALLVVDQFEELFTHNPQEVQARFAYLLGAIAREADVRVVVSLRDDFLFRCSEHEALQPLFDALTPLRPPSVAALVKAVTEPAKEEGFSFEDGGLVEEMVGAVMPERGALPLLAFAVSRLWDTRDRERRLLTREAYREIGGVEGALARHAETTLESIGPSREGIVREVFRNLTTALGTRAVLDREELLSAFPDRKAAEEVLSWLVDARLLTSYETEARDGTPSRHGVEIVHESLLKAWPRLVRWQTQDADGAQLRDQLRQAARLWEERGRVEDLLWTGASYLDYRAWRARYPGGLSSLEEDFAQAMAGLANRQRRRRRIAVGVAITVLVIGLGVVATLWGRSERSRQRAAAEALRAEAAKLLALGQLQLDAYPTAALAYATKSLELADTEEVRRFAVQALWRGPTAFILPLPQGGWRRLDFSPDGKWLATSSFDAEVLVWPSSGGPPIVLGGHERAGDHRQVIFGPGSDLLTTKTGRDDPLRIWSIPKGELVRKMEFDEFTLFIQRGQRLLTFTDIPGGEAKSVKSWPLLQGPARDLGRLVVTGGWDVDEAAERLVYVRGRQILLRALEGLEHGAERLIGTHPEKVKWFAIGPGDRLVSQDEKGEIRVWSAESRDARPLRVLQGPAAAKYISFDATGDRVVAGIEKERSILVWDISGPPDAQPLVLHRADATMFEQMATRGQWLAAANESSVSFWPLTRQYPRVLVGHTDRVWKLRFAPDGRWIVTGSWDGTARVWPLDERAPSESWVALQPGIYVYEVAVDPSGSRLLVTDALGNIFLRRPFDGRPPSRLNPGVYAPGGAAFDREGRRVAVGAGYAPTPAGSVIRIWDLESGKVTDLDLLEGQRTVEAPGFKGGIQDLEFGPDGRLYSAGFGGVRRWDIERGTSETVIEGRWMMMDLSDDGRHLLTANREGVGPEVPSVVDFHDLGTRTSRRLASHGAEVVAVALDPTARIVVTGSFDGTVRAGPVTGEEPHLFFGHKGVVYAVAVSPDGRWIASGGQDGTLRLWPMPDVSKPPLHTLPHQELLAKLKTLTNLRVVEDKHSPGGYRLDVGPFPGWESAPSW